MDVYEPRLRRRGFFLHSSENSEPDTGEHENPEGLGVRVRVEARTAPRQIASGGRSHNASRIEDTNPQIRSGSVTGSRQRAHLPR
jgi:hypothetical protein